jgi:hypothetical protein
VTVAGRGRAALTPIKPSGKYDMSPAGGIA